MKRIFADHDKIPFFCPLGKQKKKKKPRVMREFTATELAVSNKDVQCGVLFVIHVGEADWRRQLFSF